ncbi:hypothetical protein DF186_18470, partial [Enterococcus hirae]
RLGEKRILEISLLLFFNFIVISVFLFNKFQLRVFCLKGNLFSLFFFVLPSAVGAFCWYQF